MTHAPTFAFGLYLFIPQRQLLLKSGQAVRVGCRALDLLTALVERPGQLITKRELLELAWPSTTVVEGNLKVHIAALRRALDDDADLAKYIATVNGRGYRFIAPVETGEASTVLARAEPSPPLVAEGRPKSIVPSEGGFEDIVGLLAQTPRPVILDLPAGDEPSEISAPPRRVLLIELTARDEAWIEDVLAHHWRVASATR